MTQFQSNPDVNTHNTIPGIPRGSGLGLSGKVKPLRLLWLLFPLVLAISSSFLLKQDQDSFLIWWMVLLVFGIGAFPISSWLFSSFRGKGYGFAKAIGILFVSFLVWTLCYIRVTTFTIGWIIIFLAVLYAVSWGIPTTRNAALSALSSEKDLKMIAFEECIFVVALVAWCFIKAMYPAINGEEKFMDFAFLNSLLRADTLPALDPWLAGKTINYYYYGQFVYALITKLSGITSGIAYNFSMCTAFALAFSMSFSLGTLFLGGAKFAAKKISTFIYVTGGILSGLAVTVFGNSHSFFYDPNGFGNRFLDFIGKMGIDVGDTKFFFFPDSTRFIGWNPNSVVVDSVSGEVIKVGDRTIHEFPSYSYLLGDLHAHVISLMIVMLITAVLYAFYIRGKNPSGDELLLKKCNFDFSETTFFNRLSYECKKLFKPEIIIVAILLGMATMCNYWDFLIYFIVGSMVLFIHSIKSSKYFSTAIGFPVFIVQVALILGVYLKVSQMAITHVGLQLVVLLVSLVLTTLFPCALTRTGLGMSFLFSISSLMSLTFNANFDMIANSLARTENQSSTFQFLIVWGVHILFAIALIIITLASAFNYRKPSNTGDDDLQSNAVARFFAKMNPTDLFMSGLAVVSFIVLAAPEIFYVRDIYGGSYKRSNTMFKFAFAGFVLLSLIMIYTFIRVLYLHKKNTVRTVFWGIGTIVLLFLLFIPVHYPTVSIPQRSGEISLSKYKTIDGTVALETRDSPQLPGKGPGSLLGYANGIKWLNENVKGYVNICEAYGSSYTDFCVVSAYTGLPTIMGWQTHEWLWRFQGIVDDKGELVSNPNKPDVWADVLTPRQNDVKKIYTSSTLMEVTGLLAKYDVTYLIVGDLERAQFDTDSQSVNVDFLKTLGKVVFEEGSFCIIKVKE